MKALLGAAVVFILPMIPIRIIDGDTFVAQVQLRPNLVEEVTVRLDCDLPDGGYYNAPELRADGGGLRERRMLGFFLSSPGDAGAGHYLITQWKNDKYGRLLGEPYVGTSGYCEGVLP